VSRRGHREIKGFWWVPDHPETRWFGTLTLEPDQRPKLELIIERQGWTHPTPPPPGLVIYGADEHGKPITLLFVGKPSEHFTGTMLRRTCLAGYALLGVHLAATDRFTAQSIRFQTHHSHPVVANRTLNNQLEFRQLCRNRSVSDFGFRSVFRRIFFSIVLAKLPACILARPCWLNSPNGFIPNNSAAV
jgi:hypothetical protein